MKFTRAKLLIILGAITVAGVVLSVFLSANRADTTSTRIRWAGWRDCRVALREQRIFLYDGTDGTGKPVVRPLHYRQLGPVRVESGPSQMP